MVVEEGQVVDEEGDDLSAAMKVEETLRAEKEMHRSLPLRPLQQQQHHLPYLQRLLLQLSREGSDDDDKAK